MQKAKEKTFWALCGALILGVLDVLVQTIHEITVGALVGASQVIATGNFDWPSVGQRALIGAALGVVARWGKYVIKEILEGSDG